MSPIAICTLRGKGPLNEMGLRETLLRQPKKRQGSRRRRRASVEIVVSEVSSGLARVADLPFRLHEGGTRAGWCGDVVQR